MTNQGNNRKSGIRYKAAEEYISFHEKLLKLDYKEAFRHQPGYPNRYDELLFGAFHAKNKYDFFEKETSSGVSNTQKK